jgi:asparagine synthase (glutamine-hydrolysing)
MCGIAGGLAFRAGLPLSRAELEQMITRVRHRGPDGFGYHVAAPVGLAHARLSIIDLTTGDQPICNEDRSVWVVFNGEIFNYVELRRELRSLGHRFATQSDTETIVHAYEEFGDDFVQHLNGQFAIALWDSHRQRLLLARDRTGIRPLFWCEDASRLLFASEIKSLRPVLSHALQLDPRGLGQVFTFWSTAGEQTVFDGIRSLPAGCMLVAENGKRTLRRYWDWRVPSTLATVSIDEAAEELRARLIDAVRLQLRADVPVGAYLSGGLDSSGIVALIRNFTATPVRTFSVAFEDREFDESEHQQAMVRHLGTDHSTILCRRTDIAAQFPRLIEHTETPVLRTAPVPLMLLSGLVRQSGFKVVLTGEGADEVFGGYDIFKEAKIRRFWAREPGSQGRAALLTRLYPYLRHSPVGQAGMAASFYGQRLQQTADPFYAHRPRWATTGRLWNFFAPAVRSELAARPIESDLQALLPADHGQREGLARDQYVEAQTLLTGYLLSSQGDRVAMANSIEGRFPFLDHTVIEFANALPARLKLRGLTEKAVLRRALASLLPADIIERTKQPYRAPDSQSFFYDGTAPDYVSALMDPARVAASGLFDAQAVKRLFEKCRAGRAIGFSDNMAFVGILSTLLLEEAMVR